MKFSRLLLLGTFLFSAGAARAQSDRVLSLQECARLAVTASPQLRAAQARVATALANVQEARDRRLPDISVSGSYLRLAQPTVDLKVPLGNSGSQGESGSEGETASRSISVNQAAYGIANLTIPVYSGGRIQYGIQSANFLAQAARLDATQDRGAVIQNAVAAFVNLYKATISLQLVTENLRQANARVQDMQRLEQNGLLARNDLLKAQLQAGNVDLARVTAENDLALARINMNLMLGLPEETMLQVDTVLTAPTDMRTLSDWEDRALASRSDLAAQQQRIQAANVGIKAARAGLLPTIGITGGYIAAYVPNLITITNAVNAGVGISYTPSSLWKGNATVTQARARAQEATAGADALSNGIRSQIATAYHAYVLSLRRIDVLKTAVTQADENYRIVANKFDNSLATTTDLLEADVSRLQARLNHAFAIADAVTTYHKLLQTANAETLVPAS